ncbi:MAG: T9SS type A sorting domain-containing protein [Saprospiraceae bacterium]
MRLNYTLVVTLCCCLFSPLFMSAQTVWNGSVSTDWFTAANWSNGLPTTGNSAIINDANLARQPIIQQVLSVDFAIRNSATISNEAQVMLTAAGSLDNMLGGNFINNGQVINSGTIAQQGTWDNNGELINQNTLTNNGVITNDTDARFVNVSNLINNADINNSGTLFNQGEWTNVLNIYNAGMLVNQGTFNHVFRSYLQNNPTGSIENSATLNIEGAIDNDGTINNTGSLDILDRGILNNNDHIINDNIFNNAGDFNNVGNFTNTNQFTNAAGDSNFNNTGNAENANCARWIQRSNVAIQGLLNNGIVDAINGATVNVLPASIGVVLNNTGDVARPDAQCVNNFMTSIGASGEVVISPDDIDAGSTADYCNITSRNVTPNTFTCADAGQQQVTLVVTDAFGTETRCQTTITIEDTGMDAAGGTIACNASVNVSIPAFCAPTEITYDIVAEGSFDCNGAIYEVQIEGRETPFITGDDVGKVLRVYVTEPIAGTTCSGTITVEDKSAPTFRSCRDTTLFCINNLAPMSEGGDAPDPEVLDCVGYTLNYYDDYNMENCGSAVIQSIERTWVAVGTNGMRAECVQMIDIEGISFIDYPVTCPQDVELECTVDGSAIDTEPSATGYPYITIDGTLYELNQDTLSLCGIGSTYRDAVFDDNCGGGEKIYRYWTAYEWCDASTIFTCLQIIKITDNQPPIIDVTLDISANTDVVECGAVINLPPATITDCTDVTVRIETPSGTIDGNGGQIPAPGLTIGESTVTYIAVDKCGNESRQEVNVFIDDKTPPQAICVERLNVSLNNDGFAQLFPYHIEIDSRDNCGVESMEIYRMATDCREQEIPSPFTTFSCCDLAESPIQVVLRVTDLAGNVNECMMDVFIEDKIQPQIVCPPNKTITCAEDLDNLAITGQAYGVANCLDLNITYQDELDLTSCGIGTVKRTWIAMNPTGEQATCVQTIEIYNDAPFNGETDITWPADVARDNCSGEVDPDLTGRPIFNTDGCDEIYSTYKDEVFTDLEDACLKVLRQWTVLNWCEYGVADTSEWVHYQVIKFTDNTAPIFNCQDREICNDGSECSAVVDVSADVTDNCMGEAQLDFVWMVDIFADDRSDSGLNVRGSGQNVNNVYPNGTHRITYFATDGCGNESQCSFLFTVKDCKAPVSTCISGYTTTLLENGAVTVGIDNLISGSSFDNCTSYDDLRFSFTSNVNDITRSYNCNNMGRFPIQIWTTDLAGNQSFCETFITIQDNDQVCPELLPMANLSGLIRNEIGDLVEGVEVHADYNQQMAYTDHQGNFNLSELPTSANYTLTPTRNNDPKNGISTLDLILIRKHILGLKKLDSPYKIIAADVNQSNEITTFDMIQIRRLILNLQDEFSNSPAWRFVRADHEFTNPANPFADNFPELYDIDNLSSDMNGIDFIAIKMGDVNISAITNNLTGVGERSTGETFYLETKETEVKNGITTVAFTASDLANLQGMQFTLQVAEGVEVLAVEEGVLNNNHFNLAKIENGFMTVSWNKTQELEVDAVLFKLKLRSVNTLQLKTALTINSALVKAEAYNNLDELGNIVIQNKNGTMVAKDNFVLHQNQPNPFHRLTNITFTLPVADVVTLSVFDATGKQLYQHRQMYSAGQHLHQINATDIAAKGLLFYQVATNGQVQMKKMMKLR